MRSSGLGLQTGQASTVEGMGTQRCCNSLCKGYFLGEVALEHVPKFPILV
jgi:hypothetical protein